MRLWRLFTATYITQYIHSSLVNKITTVQHSDALSSIYMYCISCCNESVERPESQFSFSSFCKFLFFLPFVLPLFLYLFIILCFSSFLQFHFSFSLPSLFIPSLFPSCLYLFLPFHLSSLIFLGLYIFFHLFLSGSLLSLIPEYH